MADPQTEIYTIFCVVLGKTTEFSVEIESNEIVDELKKAIKQAKPNGFADVDADELTLHRVNISGSKKERTEKLKKMAGDFGQQEGLDPLVKLTKIYPTAPPPETIHIVIQPPNLPPSIGFEEIEDLDEEGGTRGRTKRNDLKRGRSPSTGLDTRSRKTGHSTVPTAGEAARRKLVSAIHSAIKRIPEDANLSNPATFIMLPFPSPHPAPDVRFQTTTKEEGVQYFRYMGRSKFTQLKECAESDKFVRGSRNICLYGSSGSGKSHILAAFVCQLLREGKRVVYIPDCRDLLNNLDDTIRTALCCAFYNDPTSLQKIESALGFDGLVEFWMSVDDKYLVVDQLNALELSPNKDILEIAKREAAALLGKMSCRHRYIYGAFANEQSDREVNMKQAPIKVISFLGGMNGEETRQWFKHYSNHLPTLSKDDRRLVEYLTGRIPLLLRSLFEFKGKAFDERKFLGCIDLKKVNRDVTAFFREKLKDSPDEQAAYFGVMEDCLQGAHIKPDLKQYDLRYFYVDKDHGHYTCGVAFESMMLMLRERRFQQFNSSKWDTVVSATKNPVVQGFMAEQLCLHSISTGGLPAVASHLTRMEVITFNGMPDWKRQTDARFTLRLYIQAAYNFPNIDAIILWLDLKSKAAHLYPIQITLSRDHKDSEDRFYADNWRSWVKSIVSCGFMVNSTFVWIDKKQPSAEHRKAKTVSTRQGVKSVQPEHLSIHAHYRGREYDPVLFWRLLAGVNCKLSSLQGRVHVDTRLLPSMPLEWESGTSTFLSMSACLTAGQFKNEWFAY